MRSRSPQREVELGAKQREWRPQLVTRVGDEAALVLDRRVQRASMSFSVEASREISSLAGGMGSSAPRPR